MAALDLRGPADCGFVCLRVSPPGGPHAVASVSQVLSEDTAPKVRATRLYVKPLRGEPMARAEALKVCPERGAVGDVNAERSPRQLTMTFTESLAVCGVSPAGARSNLILHSLDTTPDSISPGAVLTSADGVAIRVTMVCEPCKHGADLAGVSNRRFQRIRRYLGIVLHGGVLTQDTDFTVQPSLYPSCPDTFAERTAWALGHVPPGYYVSSMGFLHAIGAGKAYTRALPGWLHKAADHGMPVHRVLAAGAAAGSWQPRSIEFLTSERASGTVTEFDLMTALWFQNAPVAPQFASEPSGKTESLVLF